MNKRNSVLLVFAVIGILFAGFMFFQGDPYSSRTAPVTNDYIQNPVQISPLSPPVYTDDFDGANDTTALKARGYKVWYRGGGPQGPVATWFQGNSTVFSAFNGPATGYVAANYQIVTGANPIDSWLVLPYMSGGLLVGDSLYFYSRAPSASTFPDSIRVMVSVSDSTPEGTWTELGRFKVTTSGSWERKGFRSTLAGPNARFAIRYCVVDGGPSGNNSDYIGIDALTIVRSGPSILYNVPEMIYYKFENNSPTATPNYASAPVGTNPALLTGSCVFTSGGQFDSCISGSAGAGAGLNTGWNTAMPTNWTISFWLGPNQVDANPSYLWGDATAGSFRCFYGGAAYPNNILFRGGFADILITGVNPTATVVTLVYDGTNVVVYKNGVVFNTFPRTITANGSAPFKVAGYSTSSSISGKMDEFRLYNRALSAAEVAATWNQELPILVGTNNNQNNVPSAYNLSQNYPNPFNPTTKISYTLPKAGDVKLVVFDILGKEVATLVNQSVTAGTHVVNFDASKLSSGVYFYKIVAGDFTATKKMILVK